MYHLIVHAEHEHISKVRAKRATQTLGSVKIDVTGATSFGSVRRSSLIGCANHAETVWPQVIVHGLEEQRFVLRQDVLDDVKRNDCIEFAKALAYEVGGEEMDVRVPNRFVRIAYCRFVEIDTRNAMSAFRQQ